MLIIFSEKTTDFRVISILFHKSPEIHMMCFVYKAPSWLQLNLAALGGEAGFEGLQMQMEKKAQAPGSMSRATQLGQEGRPTGLPPSLTPDGFIPGSEPCYCYVQGGF